MKQYKAFIYDLDGTTVDTAYMNVKPLQMMLEQEEGRKIPYEDLLKYTAFSGEQVMKLLEIKNPETFFPKWMGEIHNGNYKAEVFNGMKEALAELDQMGYLQGVASSKYRHQYEIDIVQNGLGSYFKKSVLAEDTPKHKPDPMPLLYAMEQLNVTSDEVLYIGDTDGDCKCAHGAGVDFAYASWGPLTIMEQPEYYLTQPSDIVKLAKGQFEEIVVAGGCFWGVQEYYRRLKGVVATKVGYAQGTSECPMYEDVKTGTTNHAEVCHILYEPTKISLTNILDHLFRIIDPCSKNRQGEDEGTQYRTGVYYTKKEDGDVIRAFIKERQKEYEEEIQVEVEPLSCFFDAEEYHQNYLVKNVGGYCHVNFHHIKPEELKVKIRK